MIFIQSKNNKKKVGNYISLFPYCIVIKISTLLMHKGTTQALIIKVLLLIKNVIYSLYIKVSHQIISIKIDYFNFVFKEEKLCMREDIKKFFL